MITRIDLRHFKCFEILKLPVRPLTLLSGTNASGKSSVIQAMVLLHQTMREHEWSSRLMLNGASIRLGTAADVIDQVYGRRSYEIVLFDGDTDRFQWEFEGKHKEMSMSIKRAWGNAEPIGDWDSSEPKTLHYLLPRALSNHSLTGRLRSLTYLTAERLGPREYYPYDDPQLTPVVGSQGQYAVSILHSNRDNRVLPKLANENVPPTLFRQVEAQMDLFFPGCVLVIEQVPRTNTITLGIRLSSSTTFHRPIHTGFGITQVLPIVVAALSAKKNDLLLIENPEVHLHPAGQSAMGKFLAIVVKAGIQVIIETHSDHVLNGIRRVVKSNILSSEDVALHFFKPRDEDQDSVEPQVQSPEIDSNGNIDSWPDGFFDQFDNDMNYFAGWG